jgi:hypothetical protein
MASTKRAGAVMGLRRNRASIPFKMIRWVEPTGDTIIIHTQSDTNRRHDYDIQDLNEEADMYISEFMHETLTMR